MKETIKIYCNRCGKIKHIDVLKSCQEVSRIRFCSRICKAAHHNEILRFNGPRRKRLLLYWRKYSKTIGKPRKKQRIIERRKIINEKFPELKQMFKKLNQQ